MDKPLRFHRLVARDVRDAIQHYADISAELGESFRDLVDAEFDDIEARPSNFSFAFDNVRFAKLKRFPYIVLFELLDEEVFVAGDFHERSNPDRWRRRVAEA
jgi:hypothetical protein